MLYFILEMMNVIVYGLMKKHIIYHRGIELELCRFVCLIFLIFSIVYFIALLKGILEMNPTKRFVIDRITNNPWFNEDNES